MKKLSKIFVAALVMVMVVTIASNISTHAAVKKAQVTYKLKNGTLTISGKGKMPDSMTFKKNKKIKKVVIKKGVTSISKYAFYNCKNLEKISIAGTVKEIGWCSLAGTGIAKITIPSSVIEIGQNALYGCKKLKTVTMPGNFKLKTMKDTDMLQSVMENSNVDTINFSTPLSVTKVAYLKANNLNVMPNDAKYKSINGVIYSKDGKKLVRVPSERTELVIEEGCTDFCLQSVLYCYRDAADCQDEVFARCIKLKKITIPQSVTTIENTSYSAKNSSNNRTISDVIIHSTRVDSQSILNMINTFDSLDLKNVMAQMPDKIRLIDDMYITYDGLLLKYIGNEKRIKIPKDVRIIGDNAFAHRIDKIREIGLDNNNYIESVELHNNVMAIGDKAFYGCEKISEMNLPFGLIKIGDSAFEGCTELKKIEVPEGIKYFEDGIFRNTGLREVVLPETMKEIPKAMFDSCTNLVKINIPDAVTVIKESAFEWCTSLNLENIKLGNNVKEIQASAFAQNGWRKLTIPKTVKKIGAYAFAPLDTKSRTVTIEGTAKYFSGHAFSDGYLGNNDKMTITYKTDLKNQKTSLGIIYKTFYKKDKVKAELKWIKISGVSGYQIKLSSDKNFKKNVNKITVKKNKKSITVTLMNSKQLEHYKIRPYKKVKGKTIYGKWVKN